MPYDPGLAHRLEEILESRRGFELKKMFGGIGWILNGNMCVGVYKEWLIVRVGEAVATEIFKEKHVEPMDITGKPMKGWAKVAPDAIEDDKTLKRYVDYAEKFVQTLSAKNT
jgi:TfoX/Sxy family transcriptional regulator of competence genes